MERAVVVLGRDTVLMPTITLPDFWLLVDPNGVADGSLIVVRSSGEVAYANPEQAWAQFTPRKRDREKEQREGWRIVGVSREDWEGYFVHRIPVPPEGA